MRQPIRYSEVSNEWNGEAAGLAPTCGGEWVKWDDYAAIAADKDIEIKVLKDEVDCVREENAALAAENAALAAENERLRKAGDAMENLIRTDEVVCYNIFDRDEVCDAWNAAKEGRDAK